MSRMTNLCAHISLFLFLFQTQTAVGQRFSDFHRRQEAARRDAAPNFVKTLLQKPAEHGGFFSLDITPDGSLVAGGTGIVTATGNGRTKTAGGDVLLWDAKTGKIIKSLGKHGKSVTLTRFANRGRLLISASRENRIVRVWDVRKRRPISQFELASLSNSSKPAVSPNGRWIANTKSHEKELSKESRVNILTDLTVWDAKTGKPAWTKPDLAVKRQAFSANSKVLVGLSNPVEWKKNDKGQFRGRSSARNLIAWDAANGEQLWSKECKLSIREILCMMDKLLVITARDELVEIELTSGRLSEPRKIDASSSPSSAYVKQDASKLAYVDFMAEDFYLIDPISGKTKSHVTAKSDLRLRHAAFTADLKLMAFEGGFKIGPAVLDVDKMVAALE